MTQMIVKVSVLKQVSLEHFLIDFAHCSSRAALVSVLENIYQSPADTQMLMA
jgi:hypothetical protein